MRARMAGLIVPWRIAAATSDGGRWSFARGSLMIDDVVALTAGHDDDRPVGVLVAAQDTRAGLTGAFLTLETTAGRDAAIEAAAGVRAALSVGVDVLAADDPGPDGTRVVTRAVLRHVAQVRRGAYPGAAILAIETEGVPL